MDNLNPRRAIQTQQGSMKAFARELYGNRVRFNDGGDDGGEGQDGGTGGGTGKWYEGFSDETRNYPGMEKFKSSEDMAKSYFELEKKIGAKGVIVPSDPNDKEGYNALHKALGRPDKADGYTFQELKDLHKEAVSTPESMTAYKTKAHELGLSPAQAEGMRSWFLTNTSNGLKQRDDADEKSFNDAKTALNERYGAQYEGKVDLANKIIEKFGGDGVKELLDKGMGNNPHMTSMLINIASKLSEDTLGAGGQSRFGPLSPEEAMRKISEINMDTKHPYHNDGPLHDEATKEMETLFKMAYPE